MRCFIRPNFSFVATGAPLTSEPYTTRAKRRPARMIFCCAPHPLR
jgi:hypothetical protein